MDNIYKAILEDTLAGFWEWNIKSGSIFFSPAFKAMFGYADEELRPDMETWQSLVYPEDIPLITQSIRRHIDSNGKAVHNVEVRCIHKNGSLVWVMSTGRIVEWENGVPVRMAGCHIDIDRQKKAQQELKISEERFRGAFEYSAIGMALVSPQGRFLKANKKLCHILGYSQEELQNIGFQQITYPDDLDKDLRTLQQLVAGNLESYQLEKRYIHKSGSIVWATLSVSLVRDEDGAPIHFVSQIEDVTERKKAEAELEESKEKYSKLFRSVQDVFFKLDAEGYIVEISPSIEKYEGYKQEEFIGKHASTFYYVPAEREFVLNALRTSRKLDDYNVRLLTPDGGFVYTSINAYVLYDDQGNFIGSEGSIRDITTRVLAEEALKERDALLTKFSEQLPGVIYQFQVNPDGHSFFPFASKELIDLYGLTPEEIRYDSEPVFERVHVDDREAFHRSIAESYETMGTWQHEFRVNIPDKGTIWLRGISRPEKLPDGAVIWHGYVADVTEQKLKEQQLQNTFDLVTEQNNKLVNFAYIISHNLRTHSGNFEMLVTLTLDSKDENEKLEFMQLLKKVSHLLSETIMHLNEVVSIQTNVNKQLSAINIFEYVTKAVDVLTVNTDKNWLQINNLVSPDIEIDYNPAYMESIIFNLLSNAIKYGHPDRKNIIKVSSHFEDGHFVLEFADNGLGIDMVRNREKMFGMYRTFHQNANAKGIGLYITKNQIEAMGGKIEVESEVNVGTTFKITFA